LLTGVEPNRFALLVLVFEEYQFFLILSRSAAGGTPEK